VIYENQSISSVDGICKVANAYLGKTRDSNGRSQRRSIPFFRLVKKRKIVTVFTSIDSMGYTTKEARAGFHNSGYRHVERIIYEH
jgi:hypothetical protein